MSAHELSSNSYENTLLMPTEITTEALHAGFAAIGDWQAEFEERIDSHERDILYERGHVHFTAGNHEAALAHFGLLVLSDPEDMSYQLAYATVLHEVGEYAHAVSFYTRAAKEPDIAAGANCGLGAGFITLDRHEDAKRCLQLAIQQSYDEGEYTLIRAIAESLFNVIA